MDARRRGRLIWAVRRRSNSDASPSPAAPRAARRSALEPPLAVERAQSRRTAPGLAALAVVGLAACLAINLPGHYSVDSVSQLAQGRAWAFDDWHPPIMAWLLGLAARVTPDAALFMAGDAILCFGALLVFSTGEARPRRRVLLLLPLVLATPQALIFQGVVWKDILFADASLGGFAALALAGRAWDRRGVRAACLLAAFALFTLAAMARQTGFVVPLAGAAVFALVMVHARGGGGGPILRAAALQAAGALVAVFAVSAAAHAGFKAMSDGQPGAEAEVAMVQTFDLAGALRLDPHLALRALHAREPVLEWFERHEAAPAWRPATLDFLDNLPTAEVVLPPRTAAVGSDWLGLVETRTWLYVRVRARVFWATLASPGRDECPVVSVGVQTDDDEALAGAGLTRRHTARDEWASDYVDAFVGTPVMSHLAWGACALLLLGLAAFDVARGDRGPTRLAVVGLLASALAFTAGFFVVSVACDYRYLYLLDVAAMAALLERAASTPWRQAARPSTAVARRSSLPQPTR